MLAVGFKGKRHAQDLRLVGVRCGNDVGDFGFSFGDRAGLVKDNDVYIFEHLNRCSLPDEYAVLRAHAGSDHQRGRRCKTERTRAGNNKDGNCRVERERALPHRLVDPRQELPEPRRDACEELGEDEPCAKGGRRNDENDRNKDRGDFVCKRLYGNLRALRLLYHADDLAQEGV